MEAELAS